MFEGAIGFILRFAIAMKLYGSVNEMNTTNRMEENVSIVDVNYLE